MDILIKSSSPYHSKIKPGCGQLGDGGILILLLHLLQLFPVSETKCYVMAV